MGPKRRPQLRSRVLSADLAQEFTDARGDSPAPVERLLTTL